MATFILWAYIALTLIGTAGNVSQIGKPRKPMTSGTAAGSFLISAVLCAGVYYLYVH